MTKNLPQFFLTLLFILTTNCYAGTACEKKPQTSTVVTTTITTASHIEPKSAMQSSSFRSG